MVGCAPRAKRMAFTLIETVISVAIMAMVMAGLMYGYAQANRFAEWSSMSLAAQSYALQGLEQVRAAKWDLSANPVVDQISPVGSGTGGAIQLGDSISYQQTDIMDVPVSGAPYSVTNYITIRQISLTPQYREVWSQCIWTFPRTGQVFTNTVITYRAADRQ